MTVTVVDANPGLPVLSDDNWDKDGKFTVTANMWHGTNASSYRFYDGPTLLVEGALAARSPGAQSAKIELDAVASGRHTYTVQFINGAGSTTSKPRVVTVK